MRSSSSASPAARLNAIAPAHEPGQTSTAMSSVRCGAASTACDSVAYAGPDDHHELGAVHRLARVVPGVADRREPLEVAAGA